MNLRADAIIIHLGQEHAQDFPRLNPTPGHAPQVVHVPSSRLCQGYPDMYSQRGLRSKRTYSPDGPRGRTPRLMNSDVELINSYNIEVTSSWKKTISPEPFIAGIAAVVMNVAVQSMLNNWLGLNRTNLPMKLFYCCLIQLFVSSGPSHGRTSDACLQ